MTTVQRLAFFATPPHDCNYLPDREATTLFADPRFPKNTRLYTALADCGFRRSGEHLYMPHCGHCSACIPVRIPVAEFSPGRSQKRALARNRDLSIEQREPLQDEEHFSLYERYLASRHPGGGMDNPTPESYLNFLTASWAETVFYDMRLDRELVAVAVVDRLDNALSAVYTFFAPEHGRRRSPGRFAVLYQIEEARRLGLDYVYLGYWIRDCRKMSYKDEYRPLEYFYDNDWQRRPPPA